MKDTCTKCGRSGSSTWQFISKNMQSNDVWKAYYECKGCKNYVAKIEDYTSSKKLNAEKFPYESEAFWEDLPRKDGTDPKLDDCDHIMVRDNGVCRKCNRLVRSPKENTDLTSLADKCNKVFVEIMEDIPHGVKMLEGWEEYKNLKKYGDKFDD